MASVLYIVDAEYDHRLLYDSGKDNYHYDKHDLWEAKALKFLTESPDNKVVYLERPHDLDDFEEAIDFILRLEEGESYTSLGFTSMDSYCSIEEFSEAFID